MRLIMIRQGVCSVLRENRLQQTCKTRQQNSLTEELPFPQDLVPAPTLQAALLLLMPVIALLHLQIAMLVRSKFLVG
jgi:hypothetical protein